MGEMELETSSWICEQEGNGFCIHVVSLCSHLMKRAFFGDDFTVMDPIVIH